MARPIDVLAKGAWEYPPLPEQVSAAPRRAPADEVLLADGCYFVCFGVDGAPNLHGTLRIETRTGRLFASGDFYRHDSASQPVGLVPPPGSGIPIFPIAQYGYYLRVMRIEESGTGFNLVFEAHRYSATPILLLRGDTTNWVLEGTFTVQMAPAPAPAGYPSPEQFFVGDVFVGEVVNEGSVAFGQMQMGWISPLLRTATVEIDRVWESELPLENGEGATWRTIFHAVGWDLTAVVSDSNVEKPTGPVWNATEAHAAMLAYRDTSNLDAEWRYHVLAVQRIDYPDGDRGVMYDFKTDDTNHVEREGLLVSSHFVFDAADPQWGLLRGMRAGTTVAFFRTAVHELGHAMGLGHNSSGFAIMRPTAEIAAEAPAETPFPTNIAWSFAAGDAHRLRHWPDIVVRPGGLSFLSARAAPLIDT